MNAIQVQPKYRCKSLGETSAMQFEYKHILIYLLKTFFTSNKIK
jgi:hypothetical protein